MKKIIILTGAGVSAESGIKTFRDHNGLWENHDIMEVASPIGFKNNPELVLSFYNARRAQLKEVEPNACHHFLKSLEQSYEVQIITQNVDDLHERAESSSILHLHGELTKIQSTGDPSYIKHYTSDLSLDDICPKGYPLRPFIVWFGEAVPMMELAIERCGDADLCIIIGTSMQVYPAASLVHFLPSGTPIIYVDPKPSIIEGYTSGEIHIIKESAVKAISKLNKMIESLC